MIKGSKNEGWIEDDLFYAVNALNEAERDMKLHGPIPMVKVMLEYYQEEVTRLMIQGMAFGL